MSAGNDPLGFVPTGVSAAAKSHITANPTPCRVSFEPFGRPGYGDPDPDANDYEIIDGYVMTPLSETDMGRVCFLRDVSGREFVLTDGSNFVPDGAGELPEFSFSLENEDFVLGVKDGNGGYKAVGVNVVVFTPE